MSVIIGISSHYHDAACCLIKDGSLVAAAEEERFTRVKHDSRLPVNAFRYCLNEAKTTIGDVSCIAYYEDPNKKVSRQLWSGLPNILHNPGRRYKVDSGRAEYEIRQSLGYDGPIEFVDHHLSHAASAYFYSGFSESALLTVDGVGEWATTSYGRAKEDAIDLFEEVSFPHSLGLLYSAITAYLGFDVNDAEYKVMGLAPYGRPIFADKIFKLITMLDDGQYALNLEYFDFLAGDRMYSDSLCELFKQKPRVPESELTQFHKDVAASIQYALEEILLEKVQYLHNTYPCENLCMAGGVALNCVANAKILDRGPFKKLFVQPAASDAGGSLGAAAIAHVKLNRERISSDTLKHVYLGPKYSSQEVRKIISPSPLSDYTIDYSDNIKGLLQDTAERLAAGKVIGWFQGRMEFGPRALGARSILADPRRPEMRDRINELVKMREAFRPFAPAVLESKASEHFNLDHPSPFMLETCQVISKLSLPAITHVDGSARVQTVNEDSNSRFHDLIVEFDRLTDCPILLNTSFNVRGDAIAMNPVHAIWCFIISRIDTLVIEDFIIDRVEQPDFWEEIIEMVKARSVKRRDSTERSNVYSFL